MRDTSDMMEDALSEVRNGEINRFALREARRLRSRRLRRLLG